ncbi:MAG: anthranilate synthase component I family protein [Campylobacterota bacterium]
MHSKTLLLDESTPVAIYAQIKKLYPSHVTMLFESVVNSSEGNFSFITIGAKERVCYQNGQTFYYKGGDKRTIDESPFTFLKKYYADVDKSRYQAQANELGFSFVDGFIGFIGYDMVQVFEPRLQEAMQDLHDDLHTPDLDLVRPEVILAFSHKSSKLTIINRSENINTQSIEDRLVSSHEKTPIKPIQNLQEGSYGIERGRFEDIVRRAKEYIKSGDVFQLLISNRYSQKCNADALSFYRVLRSKNPSPYLFLLEYEDFTVCGSSPEVMVQLSAEDILLRPIAGTRKRGRDKDSDRAYEHELVTDPKERAEHIMLVDLGRNDVGRVARRGTVEVTDLMRVERYSHVMHMVSDVEAKLQEGKDMFDLFAATFTAGTMTGAPKIRAMELIAEFEGLKRGFYSGSVGYFSFNGNMDSAITIRTALILNDRVILQAGAGVVSDSVPELEYKEVRNKLNALHATIDELGEKDA